MERAILLLPAFQSISLAEIPLPAYLCSKQPDWACRAVLLMCTALSDSCWHQFLERLFPNSQSPSPFPSFITLPAVVHGAQHLAGEGSPSLLPFSATVGISWLLSTQESSPDNIISTLEGATTFCSLLAKLTMTVHPTCPAVPIERDLKMFSKPFYHWLLVSSLGGQW